MWSRRRPEDRRNSASVVELRRAAKLAQSRIAELSKSPGLRRANSCKENDDTITKPLSYLKAPYPDYYEPDFRTLRTGTGSDGDIKVHKQGRRNSSPRASPGMGRRNVNNSFNSLNFFAHDSQKLFKETRSVKDLMDCDGIIIHDEEFERKGRTTGYSTPRDLSLTDIPEDNKAERRMSSESTSLFVPKDSASLSSYQSCDYFFRVMLLGDSGVGKTCLITKFRDGVFLSGTFISTVGIDYRNKTVMLDGWKVRLQLLDTAGQERFRTLIRNYYRDAQALVLVYDIHNRESFENIRDWHTEAFKFVKPDVLTFLVGNKGDLGDAQRRVTVAEGEQLGKKLGICFLETSAKTGHNVDLTFMAIAKQLKSTHSMDPADRNFDILEYIKSHEKSGWASFCVHCRIC